MKGFNKKKYGSKGESVDRIKTHTQKKSKSPNQGRKGQK
tara:strand:- start:67 stop:183 length:117 start_codon:yes stop_codon:yes gene_type:complete